MPPPFRYVYKLVAGKKLGVYYTHKTCNTIKQAIRLAHKMNSDVRVLRINKKRTIDITNKIFNRPGPAVNLTKFNPTTWKWLK
jgi:hypothetical protein